MYFFRRQCALNSSRAYNRAYQLNMHPTHASVVHVRGECADEQ